MADEILIQNSPRAYRQYLTNADKNSNQKVELDEAKTAVEEYCKVKRAGKCKKFYNYLINAGYPLATAKIQTLAAKQNISTTDTAILFPKGYLPREGARVIISGRQIAGVNFKTHTIQDLIKPTEVTFVFDGSGSMAKRFPNSSDSKFNDLRYAFNFLLNFLPSDLSFNLNIFGPQDIVKRQKPKLNLEVTRGGKTDLRQAFKNMTPQGATYLWSNLEYSVKRTKAGGIIVVYSDGISDVSPRRRGRKERGIRSKMRSIIEFAAKNKIKILIAYGSRRGLGDLRKLAKRLPNQVRLFDAYSFPKLESFFKKEVLAVLHPQRPYYQITINDLAGQKLRSVNVGRPPRKTLHALNIRVKAKNIIRKRNSQIRIGKLIYIDASGRDRTINLSDFAPAGNAEFVFNKTSVYIPPLPESPEQRVISLVLDRSGSMSGNLLVELKKTVINFAGSFIGFDSPEFKDPEFHGKFTPFYLNFGILDSFGLPQDKMRRLLRSLKSMNRKQLISLSNSILKITKLFNILAKVNRLKYDPSLNNLIKATKNLRQADFNKLNDFGKFQIMLLNRHILQSSFSTLCPPKKLPNISHFIGINFFPDSEYNDQSAVELQPTYDINKVKTIVNKAQTLGSTPAWENILLSLAATPDHGSLVIFSDGVFNCNVSKSIKTKILNLALKKSVRIYFVGLGSDFKNVVETDIATDGADDLGFLKHITRKTTQSNSAFINIDNINALLKAFQSIKAQILQPSLFVPLPEPTAVRIPVKKDNHIYILEIELPYSRSKTSRSVALLREALVEKITVLNGKLISRVEFQGALLDIGTEIKLDAKGNIASIKPPRDITIRGFRFKGGKEITFSQNGHVYQGIIAEGIDGVGETPTGNKFHVRFKANELMKFYSSGKAPIAGGVLAKNATINGITFKANTWLEEHNSPDNKSRIKLGTLANRTVINGTTYEAGTRIWFKPSGQVIKAEIIKANRR